MLDHLADLESDFSVFHRIDDMYALDGPRFLRLAWRIAAYDGMVTRRIDAQNHDPAPAPLPGPEERPVTVSTRRQVSRHGPPKPSVKGAQMLDPAAFMAMHSNMFERVRVPKSES